MFENDQKCLIFQKIANEASNFYIQIAHLKIVKKVTFFFRFSEKKMEI